MKAAGVFILSDEVEGMSAVFASWVTTYQDAAQLESLVCYYLSNPLERAIKAKQLQQQVLGKHTVQHRVKKILQVVEQLLHPNPVKLG